MSSCQTGRIKSENSGSNWRTRDQAKETRNTSAENSRSSEKKKTQVGNTRNQAAENSGPSLYFVTRDQVVELWFKLEKLAAKNSESSGRTWYQAREAHNHKSSW